MAEGSCGEGVRLLSVENLTGKATEQTPCGKTLHLRNKGSVDLLVG